MFLKSRKERGIQIYYAEDTDIHKGNVTLVSESLYITCDNAIKYNKDNGKITVYLSAARESAKGVELSVKDTGIGIPPERYGKRIFGRFIAVIKATQKKSAGTG